MTDMVLPRPAARLKVEWKTLGLIAGQWLAFGLLIFFWRDLGWWIVAPLGACLVCLHGSLQHEALHGHPTSSRLVNEALVFPPISLWFPYRRYRALHLKHHDNDHLTDPAFDPESYYLDPQAWSGTPRPCASSTAPTTPCSGASSSARPSPRRGWWRRKPGA
jgi:fatty acid desaturase